jgi:muramoyltetrapeptide carboxypeptidase
VGKERRRNERRQAVRMKRRAFLGAGLAGVATLVTRSSGRAVAPPVPGSVPAVKAPRLRPGDVAGLINPSCAAVQPGDVEAAAFALKRLGLKVRVGSQVANAGADDRERADDVNQFFADPAIRAIVPLRGGWGCSRLLEHVDYGLIARKPKVVMGYSDVDALLLALRSRSGLVTFHGPMGISSWEPYTRAQARGVLFDARAAVLENPRTLHAGEDAVRTLRPGRARGRLWGGNLTVLASMLGSPYLAAEEPIVLFLEEVREPTSEIDRMLTQLQMAGVLHRARAVVFGQLAGCEPPRMDPALTVDRVLLDHVQALGVPAWRGAMFGHADRQLTLGLGVMVEADADRGTIRMLERAVA